MAAFPLPLRLLPGGLVYPLFLSPDQGRASPITCHAQASPGQDAMEEGIFSFRIAIAIPSREESL